MAGNVIELTDAEFESTIHGTDKPVLVDFWAPWCGPCKMMSPVIEEIADEYSGRALICKVDTNEQRQAAIEYGVTAIPTLILFKDGSLEKKWVGLTSKKALTDALDELL